MKVFMVILTGIAIFNPGMLIANAEAADAVHGVVSELTGSPAKSESLCGEQETVAFSCSIEQSTKIVSICYLPNSSSNNPRPTMQYRFGVKGQTPELVYPKSPKSIESDFSFLSNRNSTGFPLEIISFSRGAVIYDIATPDKPDYVRWAPFAGVEVTIAEKPTKLIRCSKGSVQVNLLPIKKILNVKEDGQFSDALPREKIDTSPFPITHRVTTDAEGAKTTVSYPTTHTPALDDEILKFVKNCDWEEYSHVKGSQCSNSVSASLVKDKYLVLGFESYMYAAGTPHGYGNHDSKIYRKSGQDWQPMKGVEFFVDSETCHKRINSMIYRQLKPLGLSSLENNAPNKEPLDLVEEADIYPTAQGIEFGYQQYQLGAYAQTPAPILLPWKSLEGCLRTQ